jgi:hypothetical protein
MCKKGRRDVGIKGDLRGEERRRDERKGEERRGEREGSWMKDIRKQW